MVEVGGIGEGGGATAAEVMDGSSTRQCNGQWDGGSVAMVMDSGGSNGTDRKAAQNSSSSVFCVEQNISVSVCVSKILTDIFFYVTDIPYSTRTIRGTNINLEEPVRVASLTRINSPVGTRQGGQPT